MFTKVKLILLLVLIVLILSLSLPLPFSQNVKSKVIDLSYPLLSVTARAVESFSSFKNWFLGTLTAAGENVKLKEDLAVLKAKLNNANEAELENERLTKLLDLKKTLNYKTTAARVIGRDAGAWFKTIIIDKGTQAGVLAYLPVIGTKGVIGRTVSSGDKTAKVLLITDVNSGIGAMIQENRVIGLLEGQGTDECILNYIPKKFDVRPGAEVVTSGLGSVFPKGLMIGKVVGVSIDSQNLYQTARVELSADFNSIEEVLVIEK